MMPHETVQDGPEATRLMRALGLIALWLLLNALPVRGAPASEPAFAGVGAECDLTLLCPPDLMVCVFTEPTTGPPDFSLKTAGEKAQEAKAAALLAAGQCNPLVRFQAGGAPQDVAGLDKLYVVVASNVKHWEVVARATDLTGSAGTIPAARLSTRDWNTGSSYVSLGAPISVASGRRQAPRVVDEMYFRIRVETSDRAGTYNGRIEFTGLVCP